MLIVAVMGLVVNIVVFWWLSRGDSEHVNIKGALLHVLGDLLGSVGAIAAAIGIWVTGWTLLDPILSVLVALLILRSAWSLLKGSTHILLEGAPEGMTPAALSARLREKVEGLADVHHVHLWQITSGKVMATLHVRPLLTAQAQEVQAAVETELASAGISHATVAIDWGAKAECSLAQAHDHTHAHDHE